MNQIQIPFGMRDIILEDCTKKRALRNRMIAMVIKKSLRHPLNSIKPIKMPLEPSMNKICISSLTRMDKFYPYVWI